MIGTILAILTAILFGGSVMVFKHSMGAHEKFSVKAILKHKVWLLGLAVGLIGVVTYVFAMAMAPLTTVQPLLALSTVIPILLGMVFFKERVEGSKWLFVMALALGIILVAIF